MEAGMMHCSDCDCERPDGHDHETNDGLGWRASIERCWYCGHRQTAIAPADASDQTQCAGCGLMTAIESDDPEDVAAFGAVR